MNDKSYTNWDSMSDIALSEQIGHFIKHNRVQQNKTQEDVAIKAGMSRSTLSLLERGETVTLASLIQVLRVLDLLHVMDSFKILTTISPIAMAKKEKEKRQRARHNKENDKNDSEW
jgi:transcriptional regulator with XRE-family HTH domain